MQQIGTTGDNPQPGSSLATAEIRIGAALLAALSLNVVLNMLGVAPDLDGLLGLLPLVLSYVALAFFISGRALRRFPGNPVFCNIPVFIALAVLILTFL